MPGRRVAIAAAWCASVPLCTLVAPAAANFDPASPDFHFDTPNGGSSALDTVLPQSQGTEARKIAFGLAEAFLNGTKLQHGEARCLEKSLSGLAGDFVDVCVGAVKILRAVASNPTAGRQSTTYPPLVPPSGGTPVPAPAWSASPRQAQAVGPSSSMFGSPPSPMMNGAAPPPASDDTRKNMQATFALMTIASNLYEMMHQETELAKKCLHKDAVEALEMAANNMQNVTYMGNNLGANGADIAAELSYGVAAFDKKDYMGFGIAIGTAARKTVLAKDISSSGDLITTKDMEQISAGLMEGLFADGITLHVDAELNQATFVPKGTRVDMATVDIRSCILGNAEFFRVAWTAAFDLFEAISKQSATNATNAGAFPDKLPALNPENMMEMSQLMLYMPSALRMCNISHEQEEFIIDAMMSPDEGLDPSISMHKDAMPLKELVESATEAWASHEFRKLGERLGQMMRDMVLLAFPQKYSLTDLAEQPLAQPFLLPAMAAVLAAIVAVVASFRGWRAFRMRGTSRRSHSLALPGEEQALVSSPPPSARSSGRKGSNCSVRFDLEEAVE